MNVCILCGVKNEVITACFIGNPNKWTIYRESSEEVTYELKKGMITNASKILTRAEIQYIIKYVFTRVKNPQDKDMIENYGARGYSDQEISETLSIPLHEVKPIITRYWKDKMKNK